MVCASLYAPSGLQCRHTEAWECTSPDVLCRPEAEKLTHFEEEVAEQGAHYPGNSDPRMLLGIKRVEKARERMVPGMLLEIFVSTGSPERTPPKHPTESRRTDAQGHARRRQDLFALGDRGQRRLLEF